VSRLAGRLEGNRGKDTGGQKCKNLQVGGNYSRGFLSAPQVTLIHH